MSYLYCPISAWQVSRSVFLINCCTRRHLGSFYIYDRSCSSVSVSTTDFWCLRGFESKGRKQQTHETFRFQQHLMQNFDWKDQYGQNKRSSENFASELWSIDGLLRWWLSEAVSTTFARQTLDRKDFCLNTGHQSSRSTLSRQLKDPVKIFRIHDFRSMWSVSVQPVAASFSGDPLPRSTRH